jgi:peptidoglycan hydrolase-like protein with peptidoglycan-binding domain
MEWLLAAVASVVVYSIGRARGWWPALFDGQPPAFTCDIETDMPDQMKQIVLAQVATQKNPDTLNQMAATFMMGGYVSTAYCLRHQAWVLQGSQGAPPPAPTAADIAAGQALRAQQRAAPIVIGPAQSGQTLNAAVGQTLKVQGLLPYDPVAVPDGFSVMSDPADPSGPQPAAMIDPLTFSLISSGVVTVAWGPGAILGGGGTAGKIVVNVAVSPIAGAKSPAAAAAAQTAQAAVAQASAASAPAAAATPAAQAAAATAQAAVAQASAIPMGSSAPVTSPPAPVVALTATGAYPGHGHVAGAYPGHSHLVGWFGRRHVSGQALLAQQPSAPQPIRPMIVAPEPYPGAWSHDAEYIRRYQSTLRYLARVTGRGAMDPMVTDGRYGSRTQTAVMAFQQWANLPISGEVDTPTAQAMDASVHALSATHAGQMGGEEGGEMTGRREISGQVLGEEGGEMAGQMGGEEGGEMTGVVGPATHPRSMVGVIGPATQPRHMALFTPNYGPGQHAGVVGPVTAPAWSRPLWPWH